MSRVSAASPPSKNPQTEKEGSIQSNFFSTKDSKSEAEGNVHLCKQLFLN